MEWTGLRDPKCPKCNKGLGIGPIFDLLEPGLHRLVHACGMRIIFSVRREGQDDS